MARVKKPKLARPSIGGKVPRNDPVVYGVRKSNSSTKPTANQTKPTVNQSVPHTPRSPKSRPAPLGIARSKPPRFHVKSPHHKIFEPLVEDMFEFFKSGADTLKELQESVETYIIYLVKDYLRSRVRSRKGRKY